ncbi:hypothetical protein N5A93_06435 [Roseovarius sp. EGI FJ00037]|uniref:hypothetical protein n=1 Tax=Roseovarius salincola TaxID=2978479 RepID=UPI0022A816BD|nr:hypothetical protein [Roseovarius sp. EGI FJ00037]MCZ0811862.1 hypothetical protein [Roseovarius sp. EGI FJ00037]
MSVDHYSDNLATARLEDTFTLRSAAQEARAALYSALSRLELNDLEGEEGPFIDDCLVAIAMLEEALR